MRVSLGFLSDQTWYTHILILRVDLEVEPTQVFFEGEQQILHHPVLFLVSSRVTYSERKMNRINLTTYAPCYFGMRRVPLGLGDNSPERTRSSYSSL